MTIMVEVVKGEHYINEPTVHHNVVDIDIIHPPCMICWWMLCFAGYICLYNSRGSCDRASSPPLPTWLSLATALSLLDPKPTLPGPRGCRTTPLVGLSFTPPPFIMPVTLDGRLGTGGIDPPPPPPNPLLLPNSDPKPPGDRRDGDAIVA